MGSGSAHGKGHPPGGTVLDLENYAAVTYLFILNSCLHLGHLGTHYDTVGHPSSC